LKLIFVHLGRVVQDMAFWSAFEVGQLYVPNALVQISSIMPQKRNPVPIEHMRHMASVTAGRCDAIVNTMHNTPFTDMNDSEGEVQQAGYGAFEHGARMISLLTSFLPACQIDADRVAQNTDAACITITELADTLVRNEGLTFRQAHEVAAVTARAVIGRGAPLRDGFDAFYAAFFEVAGRGPGLDREAFCHAVSARNFVDQRDRPGGPAPAVMDAALTQYRATLDGLVDARATRIARHASAKDVLALAFAHLKEI
jgi:argininosuccinate lyase